MATVTKVRFLRPSGGRFQLGPEALSTLLAYMQDRTGKREAGGVLLGRHILNSCDIVVDGATRPMPGDWRTRTRYHRARRRHQNEVNRAWKHSRGTCTYLGEWHTHPEPYPTPSDLDIADWQRRLGMDTYTEPLFFVIVGTVEIRAWEGSRDGRLVQLHCMQSQQVESLRNEYTRKNEERPRRGRQFAR
jgi:integrative and conjugative element protein (TIGR02256 family)